MFIRVNYLIASKITREDNSIFSSIVGAISAVSSYKHLNLCIEGGNVYSGDNFLIILVKNIKDEISKNIEK